MSVHVEWDNEAKKAVLWSIVGRWTWGEFDDALKQAHAMLETVSRPVDFIFDVREMTMLPSDVTSSVKQRYLTPSENVGRLLAVGVDHDLQTFWDTFTDLPYARPLKLRYFETLDDARQFIDGETPA